MTQLQSAEEIRVMKACNDESFWYRCLPMSAILGATAHLLVKSGSLLPNARYGSVPKVILGTFTGYFLGKVSYANICADKFLAEAPNSEIAQLVRQRRGLPPLEAEDSRQQQNNAPPPVSQETTVPSPDAVLPEESAAVSTYDDLRKKNREESKLQSEKDNQQPSLYLSKIDPPPNASQLPPSASESNPLPSRPSSQNSSDPKTSSQGSNSTPSSSLHIPSSVNKPTAKNKYGDEGFQ